MVGGSGVPTMVDARKTVPDDKERVAEVAVHATERGEGRSGRNNGDGELRRLSMANATVPV